MDNIIAVMRKNMNIQYLPQSDKQTEAIGCPPLTILDLLYMFAPNPITLLFP